mmetsp:Transcript_83171/g.231949  ORF Transcript_83171/g.231949 Transcript_83171/m.231949 type:complete len:207 (+) Transcript_83171:335-955(+)
MRSKSSSEQSVSPWKVMLPTAGREIVRFCTCLSSSADKLSRSGSKIMYSPGNCMTGRAVCCAGGLAAPAPATGRISGPPLNFVFDRYTPMARHHMAKGTTGTHTVLMSSSSKSGCCSLSRSCLNCSRVTLCWKFSLWTRSRNTLLLMRRLSLSHLVSGWPMSSATTSNTSLTTSGGLLLFLRSCRLSLVTDSAHHLIVSVHSSSSA